MAIRSALARIPRLAGSAPSEVRSALMTSLRCSSGKILSEEERAAETVYIQKKERERTEKLKLEKAKAEAEKEKADKKPEESHKG